MAASTTRFASFTASTGEALRDDDVQRALFSATVGFITSATVWGICFAIFTSFLWMWLAILLAFLISGVASYFAANYAAGNGFDHSKAVFGRASSKLRGLFTKRD